MFFFLHLFLLLLLLLFPLPFTLASSLWGHSDSFRRISAALEVGWVEVLTPLTPPSPHTGGLHSSCSSPLPSSTRWPPPTLLLIDPALYINLLLCRSINTGGAHTKPSTVCMLLVWPIHIERSLPSAGAAKHGGVFSFLLSNCSPGHKSPAAVLCT